MTERCHYCECRVFPAKSADGQANPLRVKTRDHVFPKRFISRQHLATAPCITACHGCNSLKNDAPYDVFLAFMRRMRGKPHEELAREWAAFRFMLMTAGLKAAFADLSNSYGPTPHLKLIGSPALAEREAA